MHRLHGTGETPVRSLGGGGAQKGVEGDRGGEQVWSTAAWGHPCDHPASSSSLVRRAVSTRHVVERLSRNADLSGEERLVVASSGLAGR